MSDDQRFGGWLGPAIQRAIAQEQAEKSLADALEHLPMEKLYSVFIPENDTVH